jgi:hypothetical protein
LVHFDDLPTQLKQISAEQARIDVAEAMKRDHLALSKLESGSQEVKDQLKQMMSVLTGNRVSGGSHTTGGSVHGQVHAWDINPKEISFEHKTDEFGDMSKVELGRGSCGAVYKGMYGDQDVAIKEMAIDSATIAAFEKEARITFRTVHPNTITCVQHKQSCSA